MNHLATPYKQLQTKKSLQISTKAMGHWPELRVKNINIMLNYLIKNNFVINYSKKGKKKYTHINIIYLLINNIAWKSVKTAWDFWNEQYIIKQPYDNFLTGQNSIYNFLLNKELQNKKEIIYQQEIKNFVKNIVKLYAKSIEKGEKDMFKSFSDSGIALIESVTEDYECWFADVEDISEAFNVTNRIIDLILL